MSARVGVDRDQIVDAIDLDAVAGVIDHGDVGITGLSAEVAQRAAGVAEVIWRESPVEIAFLSMEAIAGASLTGLGSRGALR